MNRLAIMPYLNTRIYMHHGPPAGCELEGRAPNQVMAALHSGRCVAGLVPVGALPAALQQLEFLDRYGIACAGPVRSVALFSKRALETLTPRSRIALSADSVTSVGLLRLLLGDCLGFDRLPKFVAPDAPADAQLLIGDKALLRSVQGLDRHVSDLSQLWMDAHRLPFVFARWMVRRDAPTALREKLSAWLASLMENQSLLCRITARCDSANYGLPRAIVEKYLRGIRGVIGAAELRGQALYLAELERHAPVAQAPPSSRLEYAFP